MNFEYSLIGKFFYCFWLEVAQKWKNYILLLYIFLKKGFIVSARWIFKRFYNWSIFGQDFFRAVFEQFRAVLQNLSQAFSSKNPWKLLEIARKCSNCRFRALLKEPYLEYNKKWIEKIYVESDQRSFLFRRKTRVIYYLLVLILGIKLYTVKISIKS